MTTNSSFVEHIIPESLGNIDYVLPEGWVCDQCNNYLARKVEAPFLNSIYGRHSRFEMRIPSKRGKIPPATGIHSQSSTVVEMRIEEDGTRSICSATDGDEKRFINSILSQGTHTVCFLASSNLPPQDYLIARFVGKIAIEALAFQIINVPGSNEELVNNQELDNLRDYVRRGRPGFIWPLNIRRIYPPNFIFRDSDLISLPYEVLHEWKILSVPTSVNAELFEFYAVIAILGVEYTINCGGPELDGYNRWLIENNYA